jgi:hypothetical protein
MKNLDGLEVGETVWFRYHTGKIYTGIIMSLSDKDKHGNTATILTQEMGYRTVKTESCSKNKKSLK